MRQTTICFLLRGDPPAEVLLGFKKVRFGAGKFTGVGGKLDDGETLRQATVRELAEELGITVSPDWLVPVGHITFLFPEKPEWDQSTAVYTTRQWEGTPTEGEEVRPEWFSFDMVPYDTMWDDAAYWLPALLDGKPFQARFVFAPDNLTVQEAHVGIDTSGEQPFLAGMRA